MIELVSVFVKNLYRRDVISLALVRAPTLFAFSMALDPFCQLCRGRRRPEGMIVAHRDAPVTHAASRVGDGNFGEHLFSLFILERMEPGDCAIELLLGLRVTGDGEVDPPELF